MNCLAAFGRRGAFVSALFFAAASIGSAPAAAQDPSNTQQQETPAPSQPPANPAQTEQAPDSGAKVLQSFDQEATATQENQADRTRRWVMFGLGAPLLLLLLVTGALGIAMGIYGKPVYLAHMICAGLSITLAIVHAIVGIVWFRPF